MGNKNGSTSFREGVASDFYWACRHGDVYTVSQMLPSMSYEEISALQSNGSTALHVASFNGHGKIVQMLLDRGCNRSILNRHGLTAYQEAKTDEIRNLFRRPASDQSRYASYDTRDLFQLQEDSNVDNVPNNWLRGHSSASEAAAAQFVMSVHRSQVFRKLVKRKTEAENGLALQEILEKNVLNQSHNESSKMTELWKKFLHRGKHRVDHLIHMYTVESPFYKALHHDNSAFTSMLYMNLHEYRDRAFQGRSYRGATMTTNDISAYQWAKDRQSRVLETCTLQSTSMVKAVAEEFAEDRRAPDKHTVLLIYDFPEKCETALALSRPGENNPDRCLSEFKQEEEVLILPYTLFRVTDIQIHRQTKWYYICLTNVPLPNKSVIQSWLEASLSDK